MNRFVCAMFCFSVALTTASQATAEVNVGDKAPKFEAKDDKDQLFKSEEKLGKGKIYVLYFYPADMTGGCTKQACAFRDDQAKLADKDVVVIGISGDSVRNHQLFKQVHNLNFPLLADEDGSVAKKFGVPLRKGGSIVREINGKNETLTRGVTSARWTFVIDGEGTVVLKNTKVKAAEDSKAVLKTVESLKKKAQ